MSSAMRLPITTPATITQAAPTATAPVQAVPTALAPAASAHAAAPEQAAATTSSIPEPLPATAAAAATVIEPPPSDDVTETAAAAAALVSIKMEQRLDKKGHALAVGDRVKIVAGVDGAPAAEAVIADLNLDGKAVWKPSKIIVSMLLLPGPSITLCLPNTLCHSLEESELLQ